MKKVLFSFAIAAVAVAFVSCGNKSAQNAEGQEAEAVEEVKGQVVEMEDFTIVIPEGWEIDPNEKTQYLYVKVPKADGTGVQGRMQIHADPKETAKAAEVCARDIKNSVKWDNPWEAKDDIKIGNITWSAIFMGAHGSYGDCWNIKTDLPTKGIVFVNCPDINPNDDAIKAVLATIKFK